MKRIKYICLLMMIGLLFTSCQVEQENKTTEQAIEEVKVQAFNDQNNVYLSPVIHKSENGKSWFIPYDGESITIEENSDENKASLDGSRRVFLNRHFDLMIYHDGVVEVIERAVTSYKFSANGERVAYTLEDDENGSFLIVYDVSSKEHIFITDEAYVINKGYGNHILSPTGEKITYLKRDEAGESWTSYVADVGGEAKPIAKNILPFAITDASDLIYYLKPKENGDYTIAVKGPLGDQILFEESDDYIMHFNKTMDQIMIMNDDISYLSENGEAPKIINDSFLTISYDDIAFRYDMVTELSKSINHYGFADLKSVIYNHGTSIYYLDDACQAQVIADDLWAFYGYVLSKDHNSVMYEHRGDLVYMPDSHDLNSKEVLVEGSANYFRTSFDMKDTYYIDYREDLYYSDGNEFVKIAESVESLEMNRKTGVAYFLSKDKTLFRAKKEQVTLLEENLKSFYDYNIDGVYIMVLKDEDGNTIYHRYINDSELIIDVIK